MSSLLRQRGHHDAGKVGMVELFFDLVFVFAVTQLSHTLLGQLSLMGALQVAMLLLATWWAWIYTSWVTNWLDPERVPVRLLLFGLMGAGLVMSAALPKAFGIGGMSFAVAYVVLQLGRTVFVLWAVRGERLTMQRNFQRIMAWQVLAALAWLAGGLAAADGPRMAWWLAALAAETVAPMFFFWVPGLGRSQLSDWDIDGSHMAERCALFVIIALGESLLVTGSTFANVTAWAFDTAAALVVALVGVLAMWWIYFDTGAERAHHRILQSELPGRQARSAYTYLHLLIVGGIIVCAVADELVLAHPAHAEPAGIVAIIGGPALYLIGVGWFKWVTNQRRVPPLSHMVGLVLLAALVPPAAAHLMSALALGAATSAVLVVVSAWEYLALRRGGAAPVH